MFGVVLYKVLVVTSLYFLCQAVKFCRHFFIHQPLQCESLEQLHRVLFAGSRRLSPFLTLYIEMVMKLLNSMYNVRKGESPIHTARSAK